MLFVPTAGYDDINGDEHIFRLFIGLGCSVSALLLTDESLTYDDIERRITAADIIYVGGGNLEFLMNTWKRRARIRPCALHTRAARSSRATARA